MPLRISGKNLDIGEALRQHVNERLESATSKYFDGSVNGHVVITPEGSGYHSDCTLHLASGVTLQVDGRAREPYASFDQAADRIEKRLRRYKRRLKDHHYGNGNATAAAGDAVANYVLAPPGEAEAESFNPSVIVETTSQLPRMAVATAVLELDMSDAPVLVFRHISSARINIVYRRSDGNIGWIDPTGADADERAA
ncbi:MAG: ribosome-associated translation inhibitor RaiA [Beijerinckiaceae bacterium]